MGLRGPKPKPTYMRLIDGNPSGKPLPKNEPHPDKVTALAPPKWFDARRITIWDEICAELAAMNGLTRCDRQMLVLYVDTLAEAERLAIKLQDATDSVCPIKNYKGEVVGVKTLPWVHQLKAQKEIALKFAGHFGMTPSARSRVVFLGASGLPSFEDDPFDV